MIIDLEKARDALDLLNADNDDRVQVALSGAIAAVFGLWQQDVSDHVDESSGALEVPDDVGNAILLATRSLFYDEGKVDPLTPAVRSLMVVHRTPAVA